MDFVDRLLTCADCHKEFIFTAGEQLFFFDKQFKNDPKRCKGCKSTRAGAKSATPGSPAAAGISRTETRTLCSDCGIETTVPFKPTQGRPVLCRQCFQLKRMPAKVAAASIQQATAQLVAAVSIQQATAEVASASVQQAAAQLVAAAGGQQPSAEVSGGSIEQATAELVAAASSTGAPFARTPGMSDLIGVALETPQA